MSPSARRALGASAATIALFGLAIGLAGCPVAADLENPQRFFALAGNTGTAGGGPAGCESPLPDPAGLCDYPAAIRFCAKSGCHNTVYHAADLDLTVQFAGGALDPFFIARVLDKPPTHGSIATCGALGTDCDPASCANCMMCPAPSTSTKLVDSATPTNSWILKKLEAFVPGVTTRTTIMTTGCGDPMPTFNTGNTEEYTAAHKQCLIDFFTRIAATPGNWPCIVTPPAGGGAGGAAAGTGGAGNGGAGTGGTGGT